MMPAENSDDREKKNERVTIVVWKIKYYRFSLEGHFMLVPSRTVMEM